MLGSVLLCSLAPTIFVIVSEYVPGRFPPLFAVASREVVFYTMILPLTVILAAGINLTFYTLLRIHKVMYR